MSHPAHTSTTRQPQPANAPRIYGIYTLRGDSRLALTRIDGPDRAVVRSVRRWKLAAAALLALLWSLAALLYYLAI